MIIGKYPLCSLLRDLSSLLAVLCPSPLSRLLYTGCMSLQLSSLPLFTTRGPDLFTHMALCSAVPTFSSEASSGTVTFNLKSALYCTSSLEVAFPFFSIEFFFVWGAYSLLDDLKTCSCVPNSHILFENLCLVQQPRSSRRVLAGT